MRDCLVIVWSYVSKHITVNERLSCYCMIVCIKAYNCMRDCLVIVWSYVSKHITVMRDCLVCLVWSHVSKHITVWEIVLLLYDRMYVVLLLYDRMYQSI